MNAIISIAPDTTDKSAQVKTLILAICLLWKRSFCICALQATEDASVINVYVNQDSREELVNVQSARTVVGQKME